ncbi:hypothetical protein D3C85_1097330 [compost metagenome]
MLQMPGLILLPGCPVNVAVQRPWRRGQSFRCRPNRSLAQLTRCSKWCRMPTPVNRDNRKAMRARWTAFPPRWPRATRHRRRLTGKRPQGTPRLSVLPRQPRPMRSSLPVMHSKALRSSLAVMYNKVMCSRLPVMYSKAMANRLQDRALRTTPSQHRRCPATHAAT